MGSKFDCKTFEILLNFARQFWKEPSYFWGFSDHCHFNDSVKCGHLVFRVCLLLKGTVNIVKQPKTIGAG